MSLSLLREMSPRSWAVSTAQQASKPGHVAHCQVPKGEIKTAVGEVKGELPFQTPKEGLGSRRRCCRASGRALTVALPLSRWQVAGLWDRAVAPPHCTSLSSPLWQLSGGSGTAGSGSSRGNRTLASAPPMSPTFPGK